MGVESSETDKHTGVFQDRSTSQEWQYCQLLFGHAIQNYKDQ